jgi:three-Cys-motif partner protein
MVKWHTRQKHQFIEQYLDVWTERVAKKGRAAPELSILDLFASFGWCRADPTTEAGAPTEPWPGSAILAVRALKGYPRRGRLVVNSFVPGDPAASASQLAALRHALVAEVGTPPAIPVDYLSEDVETAAGRAAGFVNLKYPTIWMLDPYYPESLPWKVVEEIAFRTGEYSTPSGGSVVRRPELIITLMTEGLQRNVDRNPRSVDAALGLPESVWRPRLTKLTGDGANTRQALIFLYSERLRGIYEQWPTVVEVDASPGNIVYAIVLCSAHNAGAFVPKILVKPEFQNWRLANWKPTARLITTNRSLRRKGGLRAPIQRSLDQSVTKESVRD